MPKPKISSLLGLAHFSSMLVAVDATAMGPVVRAQPIPGASLNPVDTFVEDCRELALWAKGRSALELSETAKEKGVVLRTLRVDSTWFPSTRDIRNDRLSIEIDLNKVTVAGCN